MMIDDETVLAAAVNDPARLRSLDTTGLLDAAVRPRFDRLARLAARVTDVPVALISLVDDDRQVFVGAVGLPEPWATRRQTPLSHSFCQYVVRDQRELVVSNAGEDAVLCSNGAVKDLHVAAYAGVPLAGSDGQVWGALCAIDTSVREWADEDLAALRDVASSVVSEIELRRALARQSFFDPLTGLPNRELLIDRVTQMLEDDAPVVVAVVSICGIERVSLADGHDASDALLIAAARRLEQEMPEAHHVARLADERFAVMARLQGHAQAAALGQRITNAMLASFDIGWGQRHLGACVGVAISADELRRAPALIQAAEDAAARAHASGRGSVELYGRPLRPDAAYELYLETELRAALAEGQLQAAFQPIVDLPAGRVCAVEALARWNHPELGSIAPSVFIPLAEQSGLIDQLGTSVLTQATNTIAHYNREHPDDELYVSVNLSPRQMNDAIIPTVATALKCSGLDPSRLVLEVTEGVLINHSTTACSRLTKLSQLGVLLALDDFGTGYASLSYLHEYPFNIVKIDRSFTSGLEAGSHSRAIVHAAVALARALNLNIVAEGIERDTQAEILTELGCDRAQGWLYGHPTGRADLEASVADIDRVLGHVNLPR